jgi:uncharacterized YigZ family protein
VPARLHRCELEVQRSRFLCTIAYAEHPEGARALIASVRAAMPDASHHCWAYVLGPPASTAAIGMSDDGEPHGTAGRPMLQALLHSGVGDVVAVVTRYFGGTLLGKGGLVRAYTASVQRCLATLECVERVHRVEVHLEVEYAHVDAVRRTLAAHEAEVVTEEFSATVGYRVRVPDARLDQLSAVLRDLTAGALLLETITEQT